MPASSIDTFLACSIMIALVLSAMTGVTRLMNPYLNDLAYKNDPDRFQKLASYLLLSEGKPSNWGQMRGIIPDSFGLADVDSSFPYELDIDKISRLNNQNAYSLTYPQLTQLLGVDDVAFRIEIESLFEVSINLLSRLPGESETTYEFEVVTEKSGMPVPANLRGYVVVNDFANSAASSTSSNGHCSFMFNIPNSINGTALLIVFARTKANPQIAAFNLYTFGHNSPVPQPNTTFTKLSPLNYVLNVSLRYPDEEVLRAQVFTYNYSFGLTKMAEGNQTTEYTIPRLRDSSPMIMVIAGLNGTSSFAEWVSYPQLPLQIGADFGQSNTGGKIVSFSYIVTVNGVLYDFITKWGGPA